MPLKFTSPHNFSKRAFRPLKLRFSLHEHQIILFRLWCGGKRIVSLPLTVNEKRAITKLLSEKFRKALASNLSFSHQELGLLAGNVNINCFSIPGGFWWQEKGVGHCISDSSFHFSGLKVPRLWLDCFVGEKGSLGHLGLAEMCVVQSLALRIIRGRSWEWAKTVLFCFVLY